MPDTGGRKGTCQWLEGEPADRDFCGRPAFAQSDWCLEHYLRVYKTKPVKQTEEMLL